jgi:hypothetical protein
MKYLWLVAIVILPSVGAADTADANRDRVVLDCELRRSQKGAVVFPQRGTDLGHQTWWPISFQQRAYSLQLNTRYRLSSA